MAQQILWSYTDLKYRGQSSDGTVVTIEEEALQVAVRKAGNPVFDADWWTETMSLVMEHWGIFGKRWMDEATRTPRMHFAYDEARKGTNSGNLRTSGSLLNRIKTGNLTKRLSED